MKGGGETSHLRREEQNFYLILLSPLVLVMCGFYMFPALYSLYLGLTNNSYLSTAAPTFIGLANFGRFFTSTSGQASIINTLWYVVLQVTLEMILGTLYAILLNERFRFSGFFRTIMLLPIMIAPIVVAYEWRWLFNAQYGLINFILLSLHVISSPLAWLSNPRFAFYTMVVAGIWSGAPLVGLVLLGAMQSVPEEVLEAATMDNASGWARLRYVVLPLIRPSFLAVLLISTINAFQMFTLNYVMTYGGPGDRSLLLSLYAYEQAFQSFNIGYAAAIAMVAFAIMVSVGFIISRLVGRQLAYKEGA